MPHCLPRPLVRTYSEHHARSPALSRSAVVRLKATFVCQNCGAVSSRWQGKCDDCGAWNSLVEESGGSGVAAGPSARKLGKGRPVALSSLAGSADDAPRVRSGIAEFDRVTGGGFVRGSTLLVGGDPGIGKSTLLLQVAGALARAGQPVVYVSGEEAVAQIRMRAERLSLTEAPVKIAAETSVEDILATLAEDKPPALLIVDSIQTLWTDLAEFRARHRHPGSRRLAGADPLRQADRHRRGLRRPRHQGRPDRRPACRRAHGRRRSLFRGRRRPPLPHPARGQEPLRSDRRDRRLRHDRRRPR